MADVEQQLNRDLEIGHENVVTIVSTIADILATCYFNKRPVTPFFIS